MKNQTSAHFRSWLLEHLKFLFLFFLTLTLITFTPSFHLSAMTQEPNFGLTNCGNTCFEAASLQCLTHSYPFMKFIHDNPAYRQQAPTIQSEFYKIACAMFHEQSADGQYVAKNGAAGKFRAYATSTIPMLAHIAGYGQHDSQEFTSFLIDALVSDTIYHKALQNSLYSALPTPYKALSSQVVSYCLTPFCYSFYELTPENFGAWYPLYAPDDIKGNNDLKNFIIAPDTWRQFVTHLEKLKQLLTTFFFTWQSTVTCPAPCNYKSSRVDLSAIATLQMSKIVIKKGKHGAGRKTVEVVADNTPLKNLFSRFFQSEKLDTENLYSCPQCHHKTAASKTLKFNSLPSVLIIQLKRFVFDKKTGALFKISTPIQIPLEFDIDPAWLSDEYKQHSHPSQADLKYHLFGVVMHGGDVGGGHYTARARKTNSNDAWHYYSDSTVNPITFAALQADLASSQPYLLFYEKDSSWHSPREFIPRRSPSIAPPPPPDPGPVPTAERMQKASVLSSLTSFFRSMWPHKKQTEKSALPVRIPSTQLPGSIKQTDTRDGFFMATIYALAHTQFLKTSIFSTILTKDVLPPPQNPEEYVARFIKLYGESQGEIDATPYLTALTAHPVFSDFGGQEQDVCLFFAKFCKEYMKNNVTIATKVVHNNLTAEQVANPIEIHLQCKSIKKLEPPPSTVIFTLPSYFNTTDGGKIANPQQLLKNIPVQAGEYILRSIIIHKGNSLTTGAYATIVRDNKCTWSFMAYATQRVIDWGYCEKGQPITTMAAFLKTGFYDPDNLFELTIDGYGPTKNRLTDGTDQSLMDVYLPCVLIYEEQTKKDLQYVPFLPLYSLLLKTYQSACQLIRQINTLQQPPPPPTPIETAEKTTPIDPAAGSKTPQGPATNESPSSEDKSQTSPPPSSEFTSEAPPSNELFILQKILELTLHKIKNLLSKVIILERQILKRED